MGIEEKAKEAWKVYQANQEVAKAQRQRELFTRASLFFFSIFGQIPDHARMDEHNGVVIEHEDHKFWYYKTDDPSAGFLTWRSTCPECGQEADGQDFTTLAEFGEALEEGWQPSDWHVSDECGVE